MLLEKIDRWGAGILKQGIEQGREPSLEQGAAQQRALLCRQAAGRFGADTAQR